MRTLRPIAVAAFSLGLVLASLGSAVADAPPAPPAGKERGPEHMIQRFDKNNNHALEAVEVPPRMWAHISVADANKDGSITVQELQEARASGKLQWHHRGGAEDAPQDKGQGQAQAPGQTK